MRHKDGKVLVFFRITPPSSGSPLYTWEATGGGPSGIVGNAKTQAGAVKAIKKSIAKQTAAALSALLKESI